MFWLKLFFWLSLLILFYCFIGYTIVLWIVVQVKKLVSSNNNSNTSFLPAITFIVAAYNEKDIIGQKIKNTLSLNYPKDKIQFLYITDGSNDGTDEIVKQYPGIAILHQAERKGKSAALNRAMTMVTTPYVVFSDANTLLNSDAVTNLVQHYVNDKTGGVSGEKKIETGINTNKTGIGEGLYWKYESFLKQLESKFYSLVGSAGELFSIRTSLFKPIPENIILDDFFTALNINQQGYRIAYEPNATAVESPSASLKEESKRKTRIASGAYQVVFKFINLLNPFNHPSFSFQFISHKILRWFLAPVCIAVLFIANFFLRNGNEIYEWLWYAQLAFYLLAFVGWLMLSFKQIIPIFYFPFYFLFMNYCNILGWLRYISGKTNVLWDKAERARPVQQN